MTIYDKLATHREEILRLAALRGAHNVRVFGSVARREADEHSDVDFLVALDEGRTLLDLGGLLMDLRDLLDCEVDVVTDGALRGDFGVRVRGEAVSIEEVAA